MREVVIVDSVRTGLAKSFRGSFNQTRPDDLAAHCGKGLRQSAKLEPATIDRVMDGPGIREGRAGYAGRSAGHEERPRRGRPRRTADLRSGRDGEPLLRVGPRVDLHGRGS